MSDNLNIDLCGIYNITYKVSDDDGNEIEVKRYVIIENDSRYWEGDYTCVDKIDGNTYSPENRTILISDSINNVAYFYNFAGYVNANIYGTINSGVNIDVPLQTLVCGIDSVNRTFVSTSGTVSTTQIIIDYNLTEGVNTVPCTATFTK